MTTIKVKTNDTIFVVKIQPEGDLLKLGTPIYRVVPGTKERMIVSSRGTVLRKKHNKDYFEFVKPCRNNCGYLQVNVPWETRGTQTTLVHRLVALTFLERPEEGFTDIDHLDHDKENNSVENLRWTTHKDNCRNFMASEHPRNVWRNIQVYNPNSGGVTNYPDLTTALTKVFPEGIPSGSRSQVIRSIQTGGKAYGLYWSCRDILSRDR